MFLVDVDFESGVNMIHRLECIHVIPENHPEKMMGEIGDMGGYLEFGNVGDAVRYLKNNKITGLIYHCPYCKPTKKFTPEPAASLGVAINSSGCDACSVDSAYMKNRKKTVEVTDTKTIFKRLSEKLLGSK
jgi:hypothetical protein